MIRYDSHVWRTLFKIKGSVFPQASLYAGLVSIFSGLLKYADVSGYIPVSSMQAELNSALFSGFTFTLSFVLVFRTNQCYNRFWQCGSSVCTMRSMIYEACSSLVAFAHMSKHPVHEVEALTQTLVRLFSLLHACALSAVSNATDNDFPIIDLEAIPMDVLQELKGFDGKLRVDIVYQWIQTLIVNSLSSGLLNVPPPILSRVFQEMEKSMVEFNQILQVITIPFPFPYAQSAALLLALYSIFTPVVVVFWTERIYVAMIFTFVCTLGMFVIELIATEIENPFGEDINDLPIPDFQTDMNSSLLMLLNPITKVDIQLGPRAQTNYLALSQAQAAGEFSSLEAVLNGSLPPKAEEAKQKQREVDMTTSQSSGQSQLHSLGAVAVEVQGAPTASPQDKAGSVSAQPPARAVSDVSWPDRLLEQQSAMHREFLQALTELVHRLSTSSKESAPLTARHDSHNHQVEEPMRKARVPPPNHGSTDKVGCLKCAFQKDKPEAIIVNPPAGSSARPAHASRMYADYT